MFSCLDKSPKVQAITPVGFNSSNECPELNKGVMRLYSMRFCPFAQRVRLVLGHKDVKFELVNIDLKDKPNWLSDKSEFLEVPILEQDDKIILESLVVMEYLDLAFPKKPLLPKDPFQRAQQRLLILACSKIYNSYFGLLSAKGEPEAVKAAMEGLDSACTYFQDKLVEMGTKFFGGNQVSMVDYVVYPWFERFPLFMSKELPVQLDIMPAEKFEALTAWRERMYQTPGVLKQRMELENHVGFVKGIILEKKFNYDFGL